MMTRKHCHQTKKKLFSDLYKQTEQFILFFDSFVVDDDDDDQDDSILIQKKKNIYNIYVFVCVCFYWGYNNDSKWWWRLIINTKFIFVELYLKIIHTHTQTVADYFFSPHADEWYWSKSAICVCVSNLASNITDYCYYYYYSGSVTHNFIIQTRMN